MTDSTSIGIFGLGNVLMGDDAIGPHIIARLQAGWTFPDNVEIEDLGTPGSDLHPHLAGPSVLILADAVRTQAAAGELRTYRREQILSVEIQPRVSPHDPGLREALLALEFAGHTPDVYLVGLVPETMGNAVGLTPAVAEAIPRAMRAVLDELERLGSPAVARAEPEVPNLWWEKEQER